MTPFYELFILIASIAIILYIICKLAEKRDSHTHQGDSSNRQGEKFTDKYGSENVPEPLELTAIEVVETKRPSILNYYGTRNDWLMDQVAKGHKIAYTSPISRGVYCDRPNRNRSFLVNPVITQKNIFIAPTKDIGSKDMKIWESSATDVHPELDWQIDPVYGLSGDNVFYSNFSDTVSKLKKGKIKLFADNYNYMCGLGDCGGKRRPKDTLNVNY